MICTRSVHDLSEVWRVPIFSPLATMPHHCHHHFTASASSRASQSLSASQQSTAAQWPTALFCQIFNNVHLYRPCRFVCTGINSTSLDKLAFFFTVQDRGRDRTEQVGTDLDKFGRVKTKFEQFVEQERGQKFEQVRWAKLGTILHNIGPTTAAAKTTCVPSRFVPS